MKLEQSFEVAAPLERVWAALIDIERVAPCLPGAAVTGLEQDGTYDGTFSVKIGPTTASYAGKLRLEQVDDAAHRATIQANGTDRRGQGGARATITSGLHPAESGATQVDVITDYQITGRLARFGRGGMIEDIAERLLREFAQRLRQSLAAGDGAADDGMPAAAVAPETGQPSVAPAAETGQPSAAPAAESAPVGPTTAEPLQGGSLIASVVWDRARANPRALGGLLAGLLVVLVLIRRRR